MSEEMIDISKASKKLGVSKKTIRDWTNNGKLFCFRTLGGHRRFKISDIEKILEGTNKNEP